MLVFIILIVTIVIGLIGKTILHMYRLNEYVKNVPFIPWEILKKLIMANKTTTDTFKIFEQALQYHKGLAKFWIGTKLVVVCDDPENMKTILSSKHCLNKPYIYRLIAGAGDGIFSSHGMLSFFLA